MKASLYTGNKIMQLGDFPDKELNHGEVRVKIHYCGICGSDVHLFNGAMDYRIKQMPHISGHEMSGEIVEIGEGVNNWKIGDKVTVNPLIYCGECFACKNGFENVCSKLLIFGIEIPGALATHCVVPEDLLFKIPDKLSMKHAALIEPLNVAVHANKRAQTKAGDNVVVSGGGPIGIFIALVAKAKGANVIISSTNQARNEVIKSLGLELINPKEVDPEKYVLEKTGIGADIIFEAAGAQSSLNFVTKITHPHSKIVIASAFQEPMQLAIRDLYMKEVDLICTRTNTKEDFQEAIDIMAAAPFDCEKMISLILPLSKTQEAMELSATSGKGVVKVLIDCQDV